MNHYQQIVQILAKRKNEKQLKTIIDNLKETPTSKGFKDYMIMPVQRIPRYAMLLDELVLNTWESHFDLKNLKLAHTKVLEVAHDIENQSADSASIFKTMELANSFVLCDGDAFKLVAPHRRFVYANDCSSFLPANVPSVDVCFLFLFLFIYLFILFISFLFIFYFNLIVLFDINYYNILIFFILKHYFYLL